MKKIIGIMMLAAISVIAVSCSNSREAEGVAEKIQKGERLTQGDYTAMIEYLGNYATEAQKYQDVIDYEPSGSAAATEAAKKLSTLTGEKQYLTLFTHVLSQTTAAQVGADNVKLVDKYAGLIWFTAPSWATIDGASVGDAGDVVTMPDDSGTVIANSEEEVKMENN